MQFQSYCEFCEVPFMILLRDLKTRVGSSQISTLVRQKNLQLPIDDLSDVNRKKSSNKCTETSHRTTGTNWDQSYSPNHT